MDAMLTVAAFAQVGLVEQGTGCHPQAMPGSSIFYLVSSLRLQGTQHGSAEAIGRHPTHRVIARGGSGQSCSGPGWGFDT